jgi:tRNA/rRNA methyltransferase
VARLRVVLVRPETSANVGACARVVRNAGACGLDLVAPGDWRTVDCWRTAWGAQDVLEQARVFPDLGTALAGVAITVAFTGRRHPEAPAADVRDAAAAIAGLGREDAAALVFGPETTGLTNEELALCGRSATIPAHQDQPSYNLSHAVAIAAYEVFRASRPGGRGRGGPWVTHDQKEALLEKLRDGLFDIGALPRVNTDGYFADWRGLVQRADLTAKELKLLEHMARKMVQARRGE